LGTAASGLSAEAYDAMVRMRLALAPKLEALHAPHFTVTI
jgi:hypothetical protein